MNRASLRRIANAGLLSLGIAALGACSAESPAAPGERTSLGIIPGGTGLPTTNTPVGEVFKVCKVYSGAVGPDVTVRVQVDEGNNASEEHDFNVTLGDGDCVAVWSTGGNGGVTDLVTVTETAVTGYTTSLVKATVEDGVTTTGGSVASNTTSNTITNPGGTGTDGVVVTFTNTEDVTTGCTFTKGWYRNNGSSTVIAVDGRSVAEAQAIFNATPGKPGTVTFGGDASLLNLYQQFLAALNNLGGDANEDDGPDAVDDAIDAVQAGTGGSGTAITTTLTQTEISALTATLAAFNEGTFAGWPHCDD
ncbi:MAG TPA: hypothetical protein VLB00_14105 [Gemmatimonadales bacterium]|nr:hypothetical protein [Gemmatimonadales bacterium]